MFSYIWRSTFYIYMYFFKLATRVQQYTSVNRFSGIFSDSCPKLDLIMQVSS